MISSEAAIQYYKEKEPEILETKVEIDKILDDLQKKSPYVLEGNCFEYGPQNELTKYIFYKRVNFLSIIKDFKIKNMIEIGFNAGHSVSCFLAAMPKDGTFLTFDLGIHPYVQPCFELLKKKYPQLQDIIIGNSKETMPRFCRENQDKHEFYDCIHVDGGHDETVFSDILYCHFLLKPGGIMILDDVDYPPVFHVIQRCLEKGYHFVNQIPTFCFPHVILQKHSFSDKQ